MGLCYTFEGSLCTCLAHFEAERWVNEPWSTSSHRRETCTTDRYASTTTVAFRRSAPPCSHAMEVEQLNLKSTRAICSYPGPCMSLFVRHMRGSHATFTLCSKIQLPHQAASCPGTCTCTHQPSIERLTCMHHTHVHIFHVRKSSPQTATKPLHT